MRTSPALNLVTPKHVLKLLFSRTSRETLHGS